MAAPDGTTPRSQSGDHQPSDPPSEDGDERKPLHRRIADGLAPVGKAGLILLGLVATVAVSRALTPSNTAATKTEEEDTDPPNRWWTHHAGGYYECGHQGCRKKVDPTIMTHDCCGRCRAGRNCLSAAQRDYDGPGGFAHNYFEVQVRPGVCDVCDEPPEAHLWVFDFHHGDRYVRT
ncbi:hypothetical protein [Streptomyces sp. NPDC047841]|uniref:hypothetical protein n=1 Tax=Streptomyces sp. NPDC047841 TaxID=3154708 RepID=UPI003452D590